MKKLKTPSMEMAKQQKGLAQKVKTLIYAKDRTGELLWSILTSDTNLFCTTTRRNCR